MQEIIQKSICDVNIRQKLNNDYSYQKNQNSSYLHEGKKIISDQISYSDRFIPQRLQKNRYPEFFDIPTQQENLFKNIKIQSFNSIQSHEQNAKYNSLLQLNFFSNLNQKEEFLQQSIKKQLSQNNLVFKSDSSSENSQQQGNNQKKFQQKEDEFYNGLKILKFGKIKQNKSKFKVNKLKRVHEQYQSLARLPIEDLIEKYNYYSKLTGISKNFIQMAQDSFSNPIMERKHIKQIPLQILDAPNLIDDYYQNILDWSAKDIIGVALDTQLFIWIQKNRKVQQIPIVFLQEQIRITSLAWSPNGQVILIGFMNGIIAGFDIIKQKYLFCDQFHSKRVGNVNWNPLNSNLFSSGSKDKQCHIYDLRQNKTIINYRGHQSEVIGLKWSYNGEQIATGGNDNKVCIWNIHKQNQPEKEYLDYKAAVKAIAWSEIDKYSLITGGGTKDKTITLYNTLNHNKINQIKTSSQVCQILFSKTSKEFVSSHGFANNEILIWEGKISNDWQVIGKLLGHQSRILYMSQDPVGKKIVTGSGDETLRIWEVFNDLNNENKNKAAQILR